MNKILLIGGHGNIGSMLMKDRVENNYLVVGRSKSSKNIDIIDYHDIKSIINVIDQSDCRSVALLTAMSKLDDCEKHPLDSTYINIKLPELIAKACNKLGKHLIFFSTDYVYDGNIASIKNEDTNNILPISRYASQKYIAESKILNIHSKSLILRIPRIYSIFHSNFLTNSIKLMQENTYLKVATDQIFSPLSAADLNFVLLKCSLMELTGTFNCGGIDAYSRLQYLSFIKEILSIDCILDSCLLSEIENTLFVPKNSSLDSSRLFDLLDHQPLGFDACLQSIFS